MKLQRYSLAVVAIVIIVGLVVSAPAIKRHLNDWKLLPQPEHLTELYFTHPNSLPTSYQPSTSQNVSFTVHNLEYRNMNYHYQITEQSEDGSRSQILASGSFRLGQDQYRIEPVSIMLVDLGGRVKIITSLSTVNESITHWLEKNPRV